MNAKHPYTFVRLPERVEREELARGAGHDRYLKGQHSGTLHCKLVVKMPLTITHLFEDLQKRKRPPYLPGASVRGLARTTAQMIGAGCGGMQFDSSSRSREDNKREEVVPELGGAEACGAGRACLVCRVFGYAPKNVGEGEGQEHGWAGKVRFLDSNPLEPWSTNDWVSSNEAPVKFPGHPGELQNPGTRHRPFYFEPGTNRPLGWKIHRHGKKILEAVRNEERGVDYTAWACVPAGREFVFRVEYENLTDLEFAVFRFALTLAHECPEHRAGKQIRLAHKLGYGKGLGLGSCVIEIERTEPLNCLRYLGKTDVERAIPVCGLSPYLDSVAMADLKREWSLEKAADLLLYPDYEWFKGERERGGQKTIGEYEQELRAKVQGMEVVAPERRQREDPGNPVDVVVTRTGSTFDGETVSSFNGKKYKVRGVESGRPRPRVAETVRVRWGVVDHDTWTLSNARKE